jgi:esterase/lipase superfamily enzyme
MRAQFVLFGLLLCLASSVWATVYDLCVRGNGPTFTKTLRVELEVDGPDVGPYLERLTAQLINRLVWDMQAQEFAVERFDKARCYAPSGGSVISFSITREELIELAAELDRGPTQGSPTIIVLANRATTLEVQDGLGAVGPVNQVSTNVYAVRVFFATNRKETSDAEPQKRFGAERAEAVSFGAVEVTIPKDHRMGELETPSILKFEFGLDPEKHIILRSIQPLTRDAWLEQLRTTARSSAKPRVLLFIHGYNVSFADAAIRAAQLAYDLAFPGPTVFFSWPSGANLAAYAADEQAAEWSVLDVRQVLAELARLTPGTEVFVIAHSMGNRLLARAFEKLLEEDLATTGAFKEIVLTAPDIDGSVFKREIAPKILGTGPRFTLYASDTDAALSASKRWHGGYRRLGEAGEAIAVLPGMDTIDATNVRTELLGHSYFADRTTVLSDMFYLIRQGLKPSERAGLEPARSPGGDFWRFKK